MYQFIVTTRSSSISSDTCVSPEVPGWAGGIRDVQDLSTMSLAGNRTNKWASRAVVALQLAAWSAVGIILLEKGVASLQKSPTNANVNVSQEIATTPMSSSTDLDTKIFVNTKNNKIDLPSVSSIEGDESNESTKVSWRETDENLRNKEIRKTSTESYDGFDKSVDTNPRQQLERTNGKVPNDQLNKNDQSSQSEDSKIIGDEKITAINPSKTNEEKRINDEEMKRTEETILQSPVTIKEIIDNLEEHRWEMRKRLRIARINNGGGAAAAVAMAAVGAVMLVLGPAVIVLRALDERRQERRFLKLSSGEDLPPSYEQATSETDQAPTYSSLNLDTILSNPSSSNVNDDSGDHSREIDNRRRGSCC